MNETLTRFQQVLESVKQSFKPINSPPDIATLFVYTSGLSGEVGEVMELLKKHVRDDAPIDKQHLASELGDCLVYIIRIANRFNLSFEDVMNAVATKLESRLLRGTLRGSGDTR